MSARRPLAVACVAWCAGLLVGYGVAVTLASHERPVRSLLALAIGGILLLSGVWPTVTRIAQGDRPEPK